MMPDDFLPGEQENKPLITSLNSLYPTDPADAQSLQRIRARLLTSAPSSASGKLLPFSSRELKAGTHMHYPVTHTKQRPGWAHRLNVLAAVIIVSLLVGSLIVTLTYIHNTRVSTAPQSHAVLHTVPIASANPHMIDASTVWLPTSLPLSSSDEIIDGPLLRTTDGGASWQDVTPPTESFYSSATLYPLDGQNAWLSMTNGDTGTASNVERLYRTYDGGKTWQLLTLPIISVNYMTFVDRNHGWLLGVNNAREANPSLLFSTSDGGKTWQQLSGNPSSAIGALPQETRIQFINPHTGWLIAPTMKRVGNILEPVQDGQNLYVTHDGGHSWQHLSPPATFKSMQSDPKNPPYFYMGFFNEQDGYGIALSLQKGQQEFRLYPTHDGGKTWQASTTVTLKGATMFPTFLNDHQILVTFTDGIAVRTLKNGQWLETWHHTFAPARILSSSFISATTGLALVNYTHHQQDYIATAPGDDIRLLKTTDGGKSWTTVQVASPTNKVTPVTMTYLPNPGWTFFSLNQDDGSASFSPDAQGKNLANLKAKKWLVRFMCQGTNTARLTLNGQSFSTNCNQHPISKIVSFATSQSIQVVHVDVNVKDSWLMALLACTNEKVCKPDSI